MTLTDEDRPSTSRRAMLGLGLGAAALAVGADALAAGSAEAAIHRGRQYATASAAAKAAGRARSDVFPHDPARHLLRRATFGPTPVDVAALHRLGIDGWLDRQLDPASIHDRAGDAAWKLFPLAGAGPAAVAKKVKPYAWDAMLQTVQASLARQIFSERQLFEIVVDVFANRLHVAIPGENWQTASSWVRDVIRAHAFGTYEGMLHAAMKHPAMLHFLSNDQSMKADVNENLGRELLELHTVGLAAKYSEADVRASARILTGRTWDPSDGLYFFNQAQHATGRVSVLGFSHRNASAAGGERVGDEYLTYLAHHPSTARSVARALAIRFVSDAPSEDLVGRLAKVYLHHGTSIRATVDAVFKSSDFWAAVGQRMRRPIEDAVGALRVLDVRLDHAAAGPIGSLYWTLNEAGHTPYGWPAPNGYPDVAAAWLGAGAMLQRWNLHRVLVYGWWKGLEWTPPSKLVDWHHGQTASAFTTSMARRLLGFAPPKAALSAVMKGAGLHPADPAPSDDGTCGKVAALLLDSPWFQLR